MDRFCITDVGSTTTKAILFLRDPRWRYLYREVPTTVEKPHEDVIVGVTGALRALESASGRQLLEAGRPVLPFFSTSSAGGGLAMVVAGLVREITAESADRVALGAGAIVLDTLAMNDGRSPYRKIEDLKELRPDMILLAGGFDGDALSAPVFLAELLLESNLHPKLNPQARVPLIYAGNARARELVRSTILDHFLFHPVPNIRPSGDREEYAPAREAIQRLFLDHVMSQAPGYETLMSWVSAPVLPTPAAFANLLALVARDLKTRILAVDIGGATTDVFSAGGGGVFRTVSANLGMSYSILNVARLCGIDPIRALLDADFGETEVWNRIGNKLTHPTRLAESSRDMRTEWAMATLAIREAVRTHLRVMASGSRHKETADLKAKDFLREEDLLGAAPFCLKGYGLIIGSGGVLSHSPRAAAARMLSDALRPEAEADLAVDSSFMFPHLGLLGGVDADLARELFGKLGVIRLGKARDAAGHGLGEAAGYVPAPRTAIPEADRGADGSPATSGAAAAGPVAASVQAQVMRGPIRLRRELAIPGEVFVKPGERVAPDTLVARSTREFLRPFFLHVAEALDLPPEELAGHMKVGIGDEVGFYDPIASRPRKLRLAKTFHSPVEGRVEKILPSGVVVLREKPERGREVTTVLAAKELGIEPNRLKPHVKVQVGDEVEREQWLAAIIKPGDVRIAKSPVRGKVSRIDLKEGTIRVAPLLEEKEVRAWFPGTVEETSDRGCVVAGSGVSIQGRWGCGGEAWGTLRIGRIEAGCVVVTGEAGREFLKEAAEKKASGVIAGGVDLEDVLQPPGFTLVVLGAFGAGRIEPELMDAFAAHEDRIVLVDGTTQLRVGVIRPKVILPGG